MNNQAFIEGKKVNVYKTIQKREPRKDGGNPKERPPIKQDKTKRIITKKLHIGSPQGSMEPVKGLNIPRMALQPSNGFFFVPFF